MFGCGEDAGRFRVMLSEGHVVRIPIGNACLVAEIPRVLPWAAAGLAAAAAVAWAAWRLLAGRTTDVPAPHLAARASIQARARRGAKTSPPAKEGGTPRVSRRSRGASTSRSASVRSRRR